jgi:hypothetical protein
MGDSCASTTRRPNRGKGAAVHRRDGACTEVASALAANALKGLAAGVRTTPYRAVIADLS